MGKRKESNATVGRNNSQSAQKDAPKLTAWRHEVDPVNASGAANSSTRAPQRPRTVATAATSRAMLRLPLIFSGQDEDKCMPKQLQEINFRLHSVRSELWWEPGC